MKRLAFAGALGVGLGFGLSQVGFTSWDELHRMFTFADFRLLLAFIGALGLLTPFWLLTRKRTDHCRKGRPLRPFAVLGGLIFGAGWALCGACPAAVFSQLGEGQAGALLTLAGMFAGNWLCARLTEGRPDVLPPSCGE